MQDNLQPFYEEGIYIIDMPLDAGQKNLAFKSIVEAIYWLNSNVDKSKVETKDIYFRKLSMQ